MSLLEATAPLKSPEAPGARQPVRLELQGLGGKALKLYLAQAKEALPLHVAEDGTSNRMVTTIYRHHSIRRKALEGAGFRLAEVNNAHNSLGYEIDLDAERPRPVRVDVNLEITANEN